MFKIDFNQSAFKEYVLNSVREFHNKLRSREPKSFSVTFKDKIYNLRYEVTDNDTVDLFLIHDPLDDRKIAKPSLHLNIGSYLLPQSIDLTPHGTNEAVFNTETNNTGSTITDQELDDLRAYIHTTGLSKLIK